mmetsp:Transcript_15783/g.34154  ORF Transcript_15783/g.34154 Transcript_15783/m.34154 type:complete len:313 (-) Transcript_15783:2626-3564(-)
MLLPAAATITTTTAAVRVRARVALRPIRYRRRYQSSLSSSQSRSSSSRAVTIISASRTIIRGVSSSSSAALVGVATIAPTMPTPLSLAVIAGGGAAIVEGRSSRHRSSTSSSGTISIRATGSLSLRVRVLLLFLLLRRRLLSRCSSTSSSVRTAVVISAMSPLRSSSGTLPGATATDGRSTRIRRRPTDAGSSSISSISRRMGPLATRISSSSRLVRGTVPTIGEEVMVGTAAVALRISMINTKPFIRRPTAEAVVAPAPAMPTPSSSSRSECDTTMTAPVIPEVGASICSSRIVRITVDGTRMTFVAMMLP